MSMDQPGSSHFKDIKARFESGLNTPTLNAHHCESNVAKTKRLFEKTKNPINASNRFKPALKPKPKFLSQHKTDVSLPPPVPKHASFNRSIVSPAYENKFNFSESNSTTTSDGSSLCPSPMSSTLSSSDNLRASVMSDDVLPSTPTATDTPADSSSSEDSSPEYDDDEFYDQEPNVNGESSKVETLHTSIINQMKKEGLFKKLEAIKENQNLNNMDVDDTPAENENQGENPAENGVVVMREAPDVPAHGNDKYPGFDKDETRRLISMERLVCEIGMKEEYFVRVLSLMIRAYPAYLSTCKVKGNKYDTQFNEIVAEIVRDLEPVLKIHETLLTEFVPLCNAWDSRTPNLAHVLLRNVDFLQMCLPFLQKKDGLCMKFKLTTDTDAEFAHATYQFEVQVMNNADVHAKSQFENMKYKPVETNLRNSGVCFYQQLDMVHQNVVRYKLFVSRYADYLPSTAVEEIGLTRQVLEKLDKILKSIDSKLHEPNSHKFLVNVYYKLQNLHFEVLCPGRHFVKEGTVMRQTRKDLIERELILFTDTLLICHLDYSKFWKLDLLKLDVKVEDGIERENWFSLFSPNKSTAIKCDSKTERDKWVQKILQTQNELRLNQRRNRLADDEGAAFSALWVADDEATLCMMSDCARRFTFLQRRHHCRNCGYVICRACSAFALLPNGSYDKSRVCPACYFELLESLHNGTIQWMSNVKEVADKRVKFATGKEKLIKDLFIPPKNGKKVRGDDYSNTEKYLAAGTVFTKYGTKYARLTTDFNLYIFAARYDPQPAEHFYVQGYSYISTEHPADERVHFKLSQQTGPKNNVIDFSVPEKSSFLWAGALSRLN